MAKLYFYYGAMSSSKTMNLLMAAHNYETQGKPVLAMTSAIDDRAGNSIIKSRVGVSRRALPVGPSTNLFELVKEKQKDKDYYCVLLDEAQFYSKENITDLSRIVDELDIPVLAYGLKTDFRGELFEGSKALLEQADKILEIKTICTFCNKKATHNLRTNNGAPVYEGSQVQIGDEEYFPVCRKHHSNPKMNGHGKIIRFRTEEEKEKDKVAKKTYYGGTNPND